MKKNLFIAAAALVSLAACTSEDLVNAPTPAEKDCAQMTFAVGSKNMTRASYVNLETEYGEFGVYAVKTTGSDVKDVMDNYLVGWSGKYFYTIAGATTVDYPTHIGNPDGNEGTSHWFYEGLGTSYNASLPTDAAQSNSEHEYQYLKYWDTESDNTEFFAYVPYDKTRAAVTFDNTEKVLKAGNVWAMFDAQHGETMLAYTKVEKNNYGQDVPLTFIRTDASVQVAFYETVAGYKVSVDKIKFEAASYDGTDYSTAESNLFTVAGDIQIGTDGKVVTSNPVRQHLVTGDVTAVSAENPYINTFGLPEGKEMGGAYHADDKVIAETRTAAIDPANNSMCPNTYYAVPALSAPNDNAGMMLTVTFTLYSEDTNETLQIKDAKVFVARDYTQWAANHKYLYVFRITKDAAGGDNIDDPLLKPIVFDNILVEEYEDGGWDGDWVISNEYVTNP